MKELVLPVPEMVSATYVVPAAALAAELGAPVLDLQAIQVLTAEDALAALPDTTLTIPASVSGDIAIGLTFSSWVRVHDVGYQGVIAVMTDGMRRFGLPELRLGPASPELREELTTLLTGWPSGSGPT